MWAPAAHLTFLMVKTILRAFVPGVIAHPSTHMIGSRGFYLEIAPACSGLEGVGLILVFGATWLWLFRREFRFPHALLLIPASVVAIFLMNALRITALILIGAAGAPRVAMGGFHSQAGWIAFNAVAVAFALTAQRLPWVTVPGSTAARPARSTENPTAPYLAPFLAILAAAMISRAASSGFEWLYPLRFFAAAGVLWFYRRKYAALDWKFGWNAAATGALVFAMWMGLDWARGGGVGAGIASGLSGLSAPARAAWLTVRTLAAVVTVPIAEELAFRGFLLRRLVSADFGSVGADFFGFFRRLARRPLAGGDDCGRALRRRAPLARTNRRRRRGARRHQCTAGRLGSHQRQLGTLVGRRPGQAPISCGTPSESRAWSSAGQSAGRGGSS